MRPVTSSDFCSSGKAQEQVGQTGRDAFEGHVFQALLCLLQTPARDLKNAQSDLGLVEDEPLQVRAAHDADQAVIHSFGEGIVHLCAQQGHLAKSVWGPRVVITSFLPSGLMR